MSERETDRNALTPYAPNYPAQVQAAGRQLDIAAQLNQDLERRRLIGILKRIFSEDAVVFLSRRQRLDGDLIERFADHWYSEDLSRNKYIPWPLELIERIEDGWDWAGLSKNEALPWSLDLIERYEDRWDWGSLFGNKALPWSLELIERLHRRMPT